MQIFLFLAVVVILVEESSSTAFLIKHKTSEKFIHPFNSNQDILNDDPIVIFAGYYSHIYMEFEIDDGEWGYIRDVRSGKYFHPKGGDINPDAAMNPVDETGVVLYEGRPPWAHFALDQVNNHIVHRGGKFLHPQNDQAYPDDNRLIVLNGGVNENMEFKLVNTSNPKEEVFPYGNAEIVGEWVLVYSVINPAATHTETYEVTIGKSETDSSSSSFQFVWESDAGAQIFFAKMSTSASLKEDIQQSSSETWHAEIKKTDSIEVTAGQTVATWQMHFIGEQLGHKAVHQSNVFADTDSPNVKPVDSVYTQYRFL